MTGIVGRAGSIVAIAVMLAACGPGGGAPGDPMPPSQENTTVLADDAIVVYRSVIEMVNTSYASGDFREFPSELITLTADPYLAELEAQFLDAASRGVRIPRAAEMPLTIAIYGDPGPQGERTVQACRDGRDLESFGWDGVSLGFGELVYDLAELRRADDGHYQVYQVRSEVVESCPFTP